MMRWPSGSVCEMSAPPACAAAPGDAAGVLAGSLAVPGPAQLPALRRLGHGVDPVEIANRHGHHVRVERREGLRQRLRDLRGHQPVELENLVTRLHQGGGDRGHAQRKDRIGIDAGVCGDQQDSAHDCSKAFRWNRFRMRGS